MIFFSKFNLSLLIICRLKRKEYRSNGCQLLGHDMLYLGGFKIFREKNPGKRYNVYWYQSHT